MKTRCYNPNDPSYKNYGARGITMCQEWVGHNGFENFRSWAYSHGYSDTLTVDRIDTNGDYSPENCRWVDMKTQSRNRRTNRVIDAGGKSHLLVEWCEISGLTPQVISERLRIGWTPEEAVGLVKRGFNAHDVARTRKDAFKLTLNGITKWVYDWSAETGIPVMTIKQRKRAGWSDEKALSEPYHPYPARRAANGSNK